MIFDTLDRLAAYAALNPHIATVVRFLEHTAIDQLPVGRHEIDGARVFLNVDEYTTEPAEQRRWEAHRRYWDIQLLVRGVEQIGVAPLATLTELTPYDADCDIAFFSGAGDALTLTPGRFALFMPPDGHRPCCQLDGPAAVRKLVFKVEGEAPRVWGRAMMRPSGP